MPPRSLGDVLREAEQIARRNQVFNRTPLNSSPQYYRDPRGRFTSPLQPNIQANIPPSQPPPPPPITPAGGSASGGDEEEAYNAMALDSARQRFADQFQIKFNATKATAQRFSRLTSNFTMPQFNQLNAGLTEDADIDTLFENIRSVRSGIGEQGITGSRTDRGRLRESRNFFNNLIKEAQGLDVINPTRAADFKDVVRNFNDVVAVDRAVNSVTDNLDYYIQEGVDRSTQLQRLLGEGLIGNSLYDTLAEARKKPIPKAPAAAKVAAIKDKYTPLTDAQFRSAGISATMGRELNIPATVQTNEGRKYFAEVLHRSGQLTQEAFQDALPNLNKLRSPVAQNLYTQGILEGLTPADAVAGTADIERNYHRSQMGIMQSAQVYASYATTQGFRRGSMNFLAALAGEGVAPEVAGLAGALGLGFVGLKGSEIGAKGQYFSNLTGSGTNGLDLITRSFLRNTSAGAMTQAAQGASRFGINANNLSMIDIANIASQATGRPLPDVVNSLFGMRAIGYDDQTIKQMGMFSAGGLAGASANQIQDTLAAATQAGIKMTPSTLNSFANSLAISPQLTSLRSLGLSTLASPSLMLQLGAMNNLSTSQLNNIQETGDVNQVLQYYRNLFKPGGQIGPQPNDEIGANILGSIAGFSVSGTQFKQLMGSAGLDATTPSLQKGSIETFITGVQNAQASYGLPLRALNFLGDLAGIADPINDITGPARGRFPGMSAELRSLNDVTTMKASDAIAKLDVRDMSVEEQKALADRIGGMGGNDIALHDIQQIQKTELAITVNNNGVSQATAYDNNGATKQVPIKTTGYLTNKPVADGRPTA